MSVKHSSRRPPKGATAVVALAIIAVVASFAFSRPAAAHPEPRAGIAADHVMDASAFAGYARVEETYRMAAEIPQVLDGRKSLGQIRAAIDALYGQGH